MKKLFAVLATVLSIISFVVAIRAVPSNAAPLMCKEISKRYHVYSASTTIGQTVMHVEVCSDGAQLSSAGSYYGDTGPYWFYALNGWDVWDKGVHRSYFNAGNFNYGSEYFYMHVRDQNCLAHYGEPCSTVSDDAIHLKIAMLNALYRLPQQYGDFVLDGRVFRPYWSWTCNDNNGCKTKLY